MPATLAPQSAKANVGHGFSFPVRQGGAKSKVPQFVSVRPAASTQASVQPVLLTQTILFGHVDKYVPGWKIRRLLPLAIVRDEDDSFIISDEVFPVYGSGDTIAESMADYITSLVELYEIVEHDVAEGVPFTDSELARLASYVARHQ